MLSIAISLAREFHDDQYWGKYPYIIHLARVEEILMDFGFDNKTYRSAAWLHDILENTAVGKDYLKKHFPSDLIKIVTAVSKPYDEDPRISLNMLYQQIRDYPKALPVKLADRICNVEQAQRLNQNYFIRKYTEEHKSGFRTMMMEVCKELQEDREFRDSFPYLPSMVEYLDRLILEPHTLPQYLMRKRSL